VRRATVASIYQLLKEDEDQRRGEFVLVLEGSHQRLMVDREMAHAYLKRLLIDLPPKKAVNAVADMLVGVDKKELYEFALSQKNA